MSLKTLLSSFMEEVWNNDDFSNLGDYLAPSYLIKIDPGDPWEGKTLDEKTFKERVAYSRKAFPDLRFDIQEMIEEKDVQIPVYIITPENYDTPETQKLLQTPDKF